MRPLHITFVGLGAEQLGISQLSALAKCDGHTTGIAFSASLFNDRFNLDFPGISKFFDDTNNVFEAIRKQNPDVLAFGALTSTYQWMLNIAQKAKEINPNIKTVFGGVHASAVSQLVINQSQVDYVVVGEGDEAFLTILKQIAIKDFITPIYNTLYKDKTGNIIRGYQKAFIQDLNSLPFFDKTIWEDHLRLGDLYQTIGSRGCPNRCTFCFNNFFANLPEKKEGKYVRFRSVDHLIAELKIAKRRYKIKKIDFHDDVFASSKKWLEEFSWKYRNEIDIPYYIFSHPRYIDDSTAGFLKESGCEMIEMGIQTMDEEYKKNTLLRNDKNEDVENALNIIHKHNLKVNVDHMFGLPEEPEGAQEKARALYTKTNIVRINTFWTSFFPGTQMMFDAEKKGIITPRQAEMINLGIGFYYYRNTKNVKDKALMNMYKTYEAIFRMMPALSTKNKRKFTFKRASVIPKFILRPLSFIVDVLTGILHNNHVFNTYAHHYMYHLKKFFAAKIGIKIKPASKIKEDIPFNYIPKEKLPLEISKQN